MQRSVTFAAYIKSKFYIEQAAPNVCLLSCLPPSVEILIDCIWMMDWKITLDVIDRQKVMP